MDLGAKTLDEHDNVNVRATCLLSVEFARHLQEMNKIWGRIIYLTSSQNLCPISEELIYVATKCAISAFTLSLSAELAHFDITVNAVNPGPTDSNWITGQVIHSEGGFY